MTSRTRQPRTVTPLVPEVASAHKQLLVQLEALRVILQRAAQRGLPALTWTLDGLTSSLAASIDLTVFPTLGALSRDHEATRTARRATFDQYVLLLEDLVRDSITRYGHSSVEHMRTELKRWPDRDDPLGRRLTAVAKNVTIPLGTDRRQAHLDISVRTIIEPDFGTE